MTCSRIIRRWIRNEPPKQFKTKRNVSYRRQLCVFKASTARTPCLKVLTFRKGTTIARNEQIGGHKAGDDTCPPAVISITEDKESKITHQPLKTWTNSEARPYTAPNYAPKRPHPHTIYADIIAMPHHQSQSRQHMSLRDRAAQFNPFAALTGYEEMIQEEVKAFEAQS